MKLIPFNELNKFLRVVAVRGVSGFFQPSGPGPVVVFRQVKEGGIAGPGSQKEAVVPEGMHGMVVFSKTLSPLVIVMPGIVPIPAGMALDPEVVVGLSRKLPIAKPAFQQSLGQGDAGRDAIPGAVTENIPTKF